jgi:hypothetical protein
MREDRSTFNPAAQFRSFRAQPRTARDAGGPMQLGAGKDEPVAKGLKSHETPLVGVG